MNLVKTSARFCVVMGMTVLPFVTTTTACGSKSSEDTGNGGQDFSAAAGQAKHAVPTFPKGTPYGISNPDDDAHPMSNTARGILVLQGWQPVNGEGPAEVCGSDDDVRCKGHPEAQACAGTGEGNCAFSWKKDATTIEVTTTGETPAVDATTCVSNCVSTVRPALPHFATKTAYTTTRTNLLQQGWKPVIGPCCPGGSGTCSNGLPETLNCSAQPEVVDCAGTGDGQCVFVWIKDQTVIQVDTTGEPEVVADTVCRANCQ
jgi:hypothetical protein